MAFLKNSVVAGDLRVTGTIFGAGNLSSINANNTGLGTSGQLLKSTGTGIAWTSLSDAGIAASNHNHDSTYLKLSGGTMTGTLSLKANQYEGNYAMNANNSDIIGINRLAFADSSDGAREGIDFYHDSSHWDTLWGTGGNLYFTPNRADTTNTTTGNSNIILHTGNYTSYAIPKSLGTAAGDIIYFSAAGTPARLAKGSNGQVLKLANGVPTWASDTDTNTDVHVAQSNTTTSSWRKVVVGFQEGAKGSAVSTVTNQVYVNNTFEFQPSTGTLRTKKYLVDDAVTLEYNSTTKSLDFIFA